MDETYSAAQFNKLRKTLRETAIRETSARIFEADFEGMVITARFAFKDEVTELEAKKALRKIAGSQFRLMGSYEGHMHLDGRITQIFTATFM